MASDGETTCTNDPNFAAIYSFLKVFGKLYGLEIPTITKLQELIENTQEVLEPLKELHLRLLRRALKSVQSNRWERSLIKFCHQQGYHQEAWELERFSYKKASTLVKLKVLKVLLEYQFTCHTKFKTAVNALSSKDLRLDPVGTDKNGCVYWLQVDYEANLCLYKEDQDEEKWQLVARNREEFVKVISQLKSGEDVGASETAIINEDSDSVEVATQLKDKSEEDNNEEFLSPESESEDECSAENENESMLLHDRQQNKTNCDSIILNTNATEVVNKNDEKHDPKNEKDSSGKVDTAEETRDLNKIDKQPQEQNDKEITEIRKDDIPNSEKNSPSDSISIKQGEFDVSEAVEEPVMLITGEGNGADCESSYIIGEEISEPTMYIWGDGYGYENDTGNPDIIEQSNSAEDHTARDSRSSEHINGECTSSDLSSTSSKAPKLCSTIKLRSSQIAVTKRSLKKQPDENIEPLKSDPKKHCVRDLVKSDSSSSVNNDKNTNSESINSNKPNTRKTKSKVKKTNSGPPRKIKLKDEKTTSHLVSEIEQPTDSKSTIIEKRKSSISSSDHDETENTDNDKNADPNVQKETVEDSLPLKKLKLEKCPDGDENKSDETHSKKAESSGDESNKEIKTEKSGLKENNGIASDSKKLTPLLQRKTIKVNRGKFKRKYLLQRNTEDLEFNKVNTTNSDEKQDTCDDMKSKNLKSLKRSLLDATQSDRSKLESQSESLDEEPVTIGKRQKIKPKKTNSSSRKKVEAKLQQKNSSEESEEETLYSLAGKKSSKKMHKKKMKNGKSKSEKSKADTSGRGPSEDSEITPVRQSRRIAQLKIKEEADRRQLEEVTLRELKMIHKKTAKPTEGEEEWRASGCSSSDHEVRKKRRTWRESESTQPPSESDSEPLFEHEHEEPDLDFTKSDHEFSPESDLENGEVVEPLKRARTLQALQEGKDDGFCMRCNSGEQPEWILLCDKCDAGYHAACLKPLLFVIPEGDWFCPPCQHTMLIESLESELTKYDKLFQLVEEEKERKRLEEPEVSKTSSADEKSAKKGDKSESSGSSSGSWSSSEEEGAVYRLRERRQLPVSYRAREYDRLISSAIKEEYVEPSSSAGNQGRGKDISTIIEAAEEEKMKAEREALEQGKPLEKKFKRKQRRKPRKLNSLDVPSEDDDETDEDFKDTGMESTSEDISSEADKESSNGSNSSDSLPIRRACRIERKDRPKLAESSPELKKKKKGVFNDTSSESSDTKEWAKKSKKSRQKSKQRHNKSSSKKSRKKRGLTQYDAEGNVIRARVTYGGLSGNEDMNDWSPKHRTRQKKINYMEMPNTESEDEMHKSSGKHMPDSSDEFKITESDATTDSEAERNKKKREESESEEKKKAISDLIKKTAVVPLEKLPEDVTKAKTEELQAHLEAQAAAVAEAEMPSRAQRGRGNRSGRGMRGPRGRGRGGGLRHSAGEADETLSKLVGVKIKDLSQNLEGPPKPNQAEKEKKRLEREARLAEKEARRQERLQKKEEKEKLKEQKAKEREEKRIARLAVQETKRLKKEKPEYPMSVPIAGYVPPRQPLGPDMQRMPRMFHPGGNMPGNMPRHPGEHYPPEQRFTGPRLQVRPELRAMQPDLANVRAPPPQIGRAHPAMREGTLSVAGSPQPFKPVSEEPSIITRMPHMVNQQYRGPMMYPPGNPPYGYPRAPPQNMAMYQMHHSLPLNHQQMGPRQQYTGPQGYYPGHGPQGYAGPQAPRHMPPAGNRPGLGPGPIPPRGSSPLALQHPVSQASHQPQGPPGRVPPGPGIPHQPSMHGPSPEGRPPPIMGRPDVASAAPQVPANLTSPPIIDPNIQIKAEVKTEPEFRESNSSPPDYNSSSPPKDDVSRPKIKHTDSKDRRPRYPLGPYAPYGPYGPYAPELSSPLPRAPPPHRLPPPSLHQYHPSLVHNLNTKPDQPRSPLQRPEPPEPHHAPPYPHYLPHGQPPHVRPPLRPHYGMPGPPMRHPTPERSSPQTNPIEPIRMMPPHYAHPNISHPPELSRMPEKPLVTTEAPHPLPKTVLSPQLNPVSPNQGNITKLESETQPTRADITPIDRPSPPSDDLQPPLRPPDRPSDECGESNNRLSPVRPEIPKPMNVPASENRLAFINTDDDEKSQESFNASVENSEASFATSEDAPKEEASVFGGLVSYFSSQREDDIDA